MGAAIFQETDGLCCSFPPTYHTVDWRWSLTGRDGNAVHGDKSNREWIGRQGWAFGLTNDWQEGRRNEQLNVRAKCHGEDGMDIWGCEGGTSTVGCCRISQSQNHGIHHHPPSYLWFVANILNLHSFNAKLLSRNNLSTVLLPPSIVLQFWLMALVFEGFQVR